MHIANNMLELVGHTPLLRLHKVTDDCGAEVLAKLEYFNPCGSIKDRVGVHMIEAALADGRINKNSLLVEPTSGNTGVGLAFTCAVRGMKLLLTMPESMSDERKKLLRGFGATLVLTPAAQGMAGAIAEAERIVAEMPNAIMLQQFANPDNAASHEHTTAKEIWDDTDGTVDAFVAAVGTGGTITGTGHGLRAYNPNIRIVAVEPATSAVLSGGKAGVHGIQGIGAGFIPAVLDTKIYDEVITVTDSDALAMAKRLMVEEGVLCGISSGANVCAAIALAKRPEMAGKRIVCIICDTGERYLSTALFDA